MTARSNKWVASALLAALALSASAQISKKGNGYLLRTKFVPGTTINYVMDATGKVQTTPFSMRMPMQVHVLSVSNGVGTLHYEVGPMTMSLNGKPFNSPAMGSSKQTATVKVDNRGNMVGGDAGMSNMGAIGLPEKPIPIGGTWSANTTAAAGPSGSMTVKATYKLLGFQSVGGRQAAKIAITMKGTGRADVTGTGTVWLAVADGSLIKNATTMNVNANGVQAPMNMTITRR